MPSVDSAWQGGSGFVWNPVSAKDPRKTGCYKSELLLVAAVSRLERGTDVDRPRRRKYRIGGPPCTFATRATAACPFHPEETIRIGDAAADTHAFNRARGLLVRQRTMTACAIRAHFAEFGIIVGQGRQRVDGLVVLLDDEELTLPAHARIALAVLVNQLKELDRQVETIERELAQIQRVNPMAKLLSSIPGVGPITATALAATVPDPTMFRSGREFAAWLGLTPKQNSTGGKDRLGRITKQAILISGTCWSSERVTSFGTQRHAPGLKAAGSRPCLNGVGPWSSPSPLPTS